MSLKPCPFCGGTPETDLRRGFIDYKGRSANSVAIYCLACEAEFCLCYGDFPEYTPIQLMEIISERWNRREQNKTLKLRQALAGIMELIASGQLVRNIAEDHKPDFAMKALALGRALSTADMALEESKPIQALCVATIAPYVNPHGQMCGLCDGVYKHEHPMARCTICGATGLLENIEKHSHQCHPHNEP